MVVDEKNARLPSGIQRRVGDSAMHERSILQDPGGETLVQFHRELWAPAEAKRLGYMIYDVRSA